MAGLDHIEVLLEDLGTIKDLAAAGLRTKDEGRLRPGELRPAAILFVDIVGFTEISRKLTSEQLSRMIDSSFRIFELTAKAYGGYQDKVIGDAGLYVFPGHPDFPPPCIAALDAALKMQGRARQITSSLQPIGLSLSIRCGVAFGEVARQPVGGEDAQVTVMGTTVNLAQRLEAEARPGSVLCDDSITGRCKELFRFKPLGSRDLKGIGIREVFKLDKRKGVDHSLRGRGARLSPLIGRDLQLEKAISTIGTWSETAYETTEALNLGLDKPQSVRNRLLVIRGEPAIGKSRFALEVIRRLEASKASIPDLATTTAYCSEFSRLKEFISQVARIAGLNSANLPDRWDKLCKLAKRRFGLNYADSKRSLLSFMAYILDCPDIDSSGIRQSSAASFELNCRLAARACCELAGLEARQVVLVVEDLQWLGGFEPVLKDLLQHSALPFPLIVIATARPEFQVSSENLNLLLGCPAKPAGEGTSATRIGDAAVPDANQVMVIQLPRLDMEQGNRLVEQLLPGMELPDSVLSELHEKACGLPYYYEEFAKLIREQGYVRPAPAMSCGESVAGSAELPPSNGHAHQMERALSSLSMPDDIRMLLLGRLDLLSPEAKELAMLSSVLGRSFQLSMLQRVEGELDEVPTEVLSANLEELDGAGILSRQSGNGYMFEHILTREAAYDSLLSQNRLAIHGAVSDVLAEDLIPGSVEEWEILPQLITHLERAGRLQEAFDQCCELLIVMAQSGRFENWDEWDFKAREIGKRLTNQQLDDSLSSRYLRATGIKQLIQGDLENAKRDFDIALELASQATDHASMVKVLSNLAMVAQRAGEMEQATALTREAIKRCNEYSLHELSGTLHANLGMYMEIAGDIEAALACYEEALEQHSRLNNIRGQASVFINRGAILKEAGRFDEAESYFEHALQLADKLGDRVLQAAAGANLGVILQEQGKFDLAKELYVKAFIANREIQRVEGELVNLFNLGELSFDMADFQSAASYYLQAILLAESLGDMAEQVFQHCALARTYSALRLYDEADCHLNHALNCDSLAKSSLTSGIVDCCYAYYHLQRGDVYRSNQYLTKAKSLGSQLLATPGSQLAEEIKRVESSI